jgi:2-keto-3-deoxy-L-rhamnonate aldolase RhmA
MVSNPFRSRILSGEVCAVMSVKLVVSNETAMLYKMAGIHGIFIDIEQSTQGLHTVAQLMLACTYVGVSPIVRAPNKSPLNISRLLDAGAAAVVIPHVDTIEKIKGLVRAAIYAPLGERGCTNNQPTLNFLKVPTLKQNEILNRDTMLIPMIESAAAVELVDEYLAVEGVDGILIGSNDICRDIGIPGQYDNPVYQDAVTKIIAVGKKAGKPIGIGGIGPRLDLLEKFFAMGTSWSLSGGDPAMLQGGMQKFGSTYVDLNAKVREARGAS